MKTLQVDKFTSGNQPQVTDSKIYSGNPIAPCEGGARHTRQPPNTGYKIYGAKKVPTVSVRFCGWGRRCRPIYDQRSGF